MKAGVDDYLLNKGEEGLKELLKKAWQFDTALSDAEAEIEWQTRDLSPLTSKAVVLKGLAELAPGLARLNNLVIAGISERLKSRFKLANKEIKLFEQAIKIAKKTKTKNKVNRVKINDLQQGRFFHSAIDYQNNIMTLGFRVVLPDGETGISIMTSDGTNVKLYVDPVNIDLNGLSYKIKKGGIPPLLEDVWSLDRLKDFLNAPVTYLYLYRDIIAALRNYIDLPEPSYGLMAAWAVGTYFAHIFAAFPFLHFYGPKETGKSKSLEALRFLCFNAWKGRDISVAALGDTVDGMRGTVLIDQAEALPENLVGYWPIHTRRLGAGEGLWICQTKAVRSSNFPPMARKPSPAQRTWTRT